MKGLLLGLATAVALMTGCAHGTLGGDSPGQKQHLSGSARIGHEARVIVAGPALLVHATGEKPVRWFVAERVSGGDSDCAAARSSVSVLSESTGVHVTITSGHVLCASVARGATDVNWRATVESTPNLWALR
jgi:hypothetical protein